MLSVIASMPKSHVQKFKDFQAKLDDFDRRKRELATWLQSEDSEVTKQQNLQAAAGILDEIYAELSTCLAMLDELSAELPKLRQKADKAIEEAIEQAAAGLRQADGVGAGVLRDRNSVRYEHRAKQTPVVIAAHLAAQEITGVAHHYEHERRVVQSEAELIAANRRLLSKAMSGADIIAKILEVEVAPSHYIPQAQSATK